MTGVYVNMKIVVLCGGLSTERKISFSSGTKVCTALRSRGHQAVLVDLFLGLENEAQEFRDAPEKLFDKLPELKPVVFDGKEPDLEEVKASRKYRSASLFGEGVLQICAKADIVFMGLHGMNGEDGRVQAVFDTLGIRYTGSGYLGAAMTMDKMVTKQMMRQYGVRMPAWQYYRDVDAKNEKKIEEIAAKSTVPCVVKTPTGGSSVGVYIVKEEAQLIPAIRAALRFDNDILVEEYIEGRELTCAVLLDRALPSVEIVPKTRFYDYSNKYEAGASDEICPAPVDPEVEKEMGDTALLVHNAMCLKTYSRCDFILDKKGQLYFLEVNTLPGMTPTSLVPQEAAAVGISYEELCETIVRDGLDRAPLI